MPDLANLCDQAKNRQREIRRMAASPPSTFGPAKKRRKQAPVKRVIVSDEVRKGYEDTARELDKRERDHLQFLPDDVKSRR